ALMERFADREDTLVLATADHETGGLMVIDGPEGQPASYRWGTRGHTAMPVPVLAWGPESERFVGVQHNTRLASEMAAALGLGCCGAAVADPPAVETEPAAAAP
ncbi:MAG: alkaline phosphatase, partial [Acidobacteriota bacterium]